MATGSPLVYPSEEALEHVATWYEKRPSNGKNIAWEALVRELDRDDPSFRD